MDKPVCYLDRDVKKQIIAEGLSKYPVETGGLLLGYRNGNNLVITAIVGPGPKAVHQHYNFLPDCDYQRKEYHRMLKLDPMLWYLGDWHTHPDGSCLTSSIDIECMQKIAYSPEAQCPTPLMLIVGGQVNHFAAWHFNGSNFMGLDILHYILPEVK